jgi:hypothetical protein
LRTHIQSIGLIFLVLGLAVALRQSQQCEANPVTLPFVALSATSAREL